MNTEPNTAIAAVATLKDPLRRDLYAYVVARGGDVTRESAASTLGIKRSLAAFHLDRLVEEGLLEVRFRRMTGRSGPGAGRPSKLYRRSERQLAIALPPRRYDLAAEILSDAVERSASHEMLSAISESACSFGEHMGREALARAACGTESLAAVESVLAEHGFEPFPLGGEIRLRSCPFHALAGCHPALICGMNLSLMQGILEGISASGIEAVLDPRPGECCVAFRPATQ